MNGSKRDKLPGIWVIIGGLTLIIGLGIGIRYRNQPIYSLNQYIQAMNTRDYEKVYETFLKDQVLQEYAKEDLLRYMQAYNQNIDFVKLQKGKVHYQKEGQVFYELVYVLESGNKGSVIKLTKDNGKWQIVFPYKTSSLNIKAPQGTKVYINGSLLSPQQGGELSAKLLPGEYVVRMAYPKGLQPDYVTKVKVPKVSEVVSPYTTRRVSVEAPIGTIVEMAGVQKQSMTGEVVFEQVLEGQYDVKVFDKEGYLEPMVEAVSVAKDLSPVQVGEMILSPKGETVFKQFINAFYEAYLGSIRTGDVSGLENYLLGDNKEAIETEFESWFVNHKKIVGADLTIELDSYQIDDAGGIEADLLEIVTMTNQEEGENNQIQEEKYQVMLRWQSHFVLEEGQYRLQNREIVESIVAMEDSNGNWVQY
ncbi:MAG: hypothetical protein ACRCTE_08140 [Cellulosilyticaceae bacterium]